jgi:hypothetical protein
MPGTQVPGIGIYAANNLSLISLQKHHSGRRSGGFLE